MLSRLHLALADGRGLEASDFVYRDAYGGYYKVHGNNTELRVGAEPGTIEAFLRSIHAERVIEVIAQQRSAGIGVSLDGIGRFRLQVASTRTGYAMTVRYIPTEPRPPAQFHVPGDVWHQLADAQRGLILVVGDRGDGKSSLWQSLVWYVYAHEGRDVISYEDPSELLFDHYLIQQCEIGTDLRSFEEAELHSLRSVARVVVFGEIRDVATARAALRFAEAGALVIATLHARTTSATPERLFAFFPADERDLARIQLAQALHAIVSPRLARRADGRGRSMVIEYLPADDDVRRAIAYGDAKALRECVTNPHSEISQRSGHKPVLLEQALADMVGAATITRDEAERLALDRALLADRLQLVGMGLR